MRDLLRTGARPDADHDQTRLLRRDVDPVHVGTVRQHDSDAIAGLEPVGDEARREPIRAPRVAGPAERLVVGMEGRAVWIALRVVVDAFREGLQREYDAVPVVKIESGVLRGVVPRWLDQQPNRPRIIAFTPATPRDGGEGALYVLLRRKK